MSEEYVYRTPTPKHTQKYTKVKVLHTQDKHTQLSSFAWLHCKPIKSLADVNLPEYVDRHSLLTTGYLCPWELNMSVRSKRTRIHTECGCSARRSLHLHICSKPISFFLESQSHKRLRNCPTKRAIAARISEGIFGTYPTTTKNWKCDAVHTSHSSNTP